DEHALFGDEREVDRRRVEAMVDEPLRDVEGAHAGLPAERGRRRDELVLARAVVRDVVRAREPVLEVVRAEDRVVADLAQPARAVRGDVRVGADEDPGVADEAAQPADARRPLPGSLEAERAVSLAEVS